MRVGIASIMQETNTFSVRSCRLDDFRIAEGHDLIDVVSGTNSELAGVIAVLEEGGVEIVPLVYAWAMPSGRVTREAFEELRRLLTNHLVAAGPLDALVLSLHGSMAADGLDDADGELIASARSVVGWSVPIAVSFDLHANVTRRLVKTADSISAYHTDPHVDMAEAGIRAARRAVEMITGGDRPAIGFAKRPLIVPAETMNTETGILAGVREEAMSEAPGDLLELGIFPVQPWLDVPDLGLGVVVIGTPDADTATAFADRVAEMIWARRADFNIERFLEPGAAIDAARRSLTRPFIIAESADAPTAGATGDSPAMVAALQQHGSDLLAYIPVVDPAAVDHCHRAGDGSQVRLQVGASIDTRWWDPVPVEGVVSRVGAGAYRLEGASFTGMEVSMGRFATVDVGGMRLLLTERPALTSDPATFRLAGLSPEEADVIVVRSCSDFRPNFQSAAAEAVTLDVPGAATPRLANLTFTRQERPPYPLDPWPEFDR